MPGIPPPSPGQSGTPGPGPTRPFPNKFPTVLPASKLSYELAEAFVISTTIAQFLATVVLFARIWTRAYPVWRFKIDDYLICLGYAFGTVVYSLMTVGEAPSVGSYRPPFKKLSESQETLKMATLTMPFWAWGIGAVKISIACMLLRFSQSKFWRIVLYSLIGLNIVLIIFSGVVTIFQCIPYKAYWDFSIQNKKCWSLQMTQLCLYFASSLHIFTDVATSLIPLTFLRKIRKPTKDKVIIGFLMALGLVASGLSLAKVVWGKKTEHWKDMASVGIVTGLLSCLEVQTAIIAACIPTLRGAGRRALKKLGLMNRYGEGSSLSGGPKGQSKFINLGRVQLTPASRHVPTTENTSSSDSRAYRNFRNRTNVVSDSTTSPGQSEDQSTSSRDVSAAETREEEIDSESNYDMDPKTGRIIRTTEVKLHSSRTHLRDEWIREHGKEAN